MANIEFSALTEDRYFLLTQLEEFLASLSSSSPAAIPIAPCGKTAQAHLRAQLADLLGYQQLINRVSKSELPEIVTLGDQLHFNGVKISKIGISGSGILPSRGLLVAPDGPGPHPLAVGLHGGDGTPELAAGFVHNSENYHHMILRAVQHGFAVYAPQLFLWREEFGPSFDRPLLDARLKQHGYSLAALEILRIRRDLDCLLTQTNIKPLRPVIFGLSYGGFYALHTAALDERFAACYSSCNFIDRVRYPKCDWTWKYSATSFTDLDAAKLICPRALYVEMADEDELFDVAHSLPIAEAAEAHYQLNRSSDNFKFSRIPGGHAFAQTDEGFAFLSKYAP